MVFKIRHTYTHKNPGELYFAKNLKDLYFKGQIKSLMKKITSIKTCAWVSIVALFVIDKKTEIAQMLADWWLYKNVLCPLL
jgi:hypothetical protein